MFALELYLTPGGTNPVQDWLDALADEQTVGRVAARFRRLAAGHPGDSKLLGGGISELRLDFGPGYRVYYSRVGRTVLLLLCGGVKSFQRRDILEAEAHLAEYQGSAV